MHTYLPNHLKKLNRRVIRSAHREEIAEEEQPEGPSPYAKKQTAKELKKKAKRTRKSERWARTPSPVTPAEKEKRMKHRVPVFDRTNNAKPRSGARTTKKKTPRI